MKIKGLKKAVGEYNRSNSNGFYSPFYGELMFDTSDGEIWTDVFCSIGHNEWKEYHSDSIVNLGRMMKEYSLPVNMKTVRRFVEETFKPNA